jgi:hypothetical protein
MVCLGGVWISVIAQMQKALEEPLFESCASSWLKTHNMVRRPWGWHPGGSSY